MLLLLLLLLLLFVCFFCLFFYVSMASNMLKSLSQKLKNDSRAATLAQKRRANRKMSVKSLDLSMVEENTPTTPITVYTLDDKSCNVGVYDTTKCKV